MENMEFERKNQDLVNTYDKDKALWDGKFEFLEKQRDQAKDDFSEAQNSFQKSIETMQRSQSDGKSKNETQHNAQIMALEHKYSHRIKEINEQS